MSPQSPRSDPGLVHTRGSSNSDSSGNGHCNDDRFLYKHRRKDQKKKSAFPKSGGPSILVYVRDNPRKNCGKSMYQQYGLLPPLPIIPPISGAPQAFDPLRLPAYWNQGLLMLPPLPPLPPHSLQPSFPVPPLRQRFSSNPNIGYTSQQASNLSAYPPGASSAMYPPGTSSAMYPPGTSSTMYPPGTSSSLSAGSSTFVTQSSAGKPNASLPPYPLVTSPYYLPLYNPIAADGTQTAAQRTGAAPRVPTATQNIVNPVNLTSSNGASSVPNSKYTSAQIPMKMEHELDTSPRQYSHSLPGTLPSSYPNYYNRCTCEQCCYQYQDLSSFTDQSSPTFSEESTSSANSSTDSGFVEAGKSFSAFKEEKLGASNVHDGQGERLLVYCDQDNPTFSLDPASLSQIMGMASRENIDLYEPLFLDEKRLIRKKIPCRNLSQTGVCQFGETCWFNHQITPYHNH